MPLPGHQNGQSTYRLILTLSIAFLLHTLILAAVLHNWILQPEPEASTVRFTLLAKSEDDSAASPQSRGSSASEQAPSEISRESAAALPEIARVTRTAEPAQSENPSRARPEKNQTSDTAKRAVTESQRPEPAPQSAPNPQAVASEQRNNGSPVDTPNPETDELRARIPERIVEQDPYITILWQYISDELDSRPVRSIRDLNQMRTVRLELHLMENGALRRVDTIESSGKPTLDQAARQSALAASPYPRPPESAREQGFRFQVELRFTPLPGD